jgi:hypothetical protein
MKKLIVLGILMVLVTLGAFFAAPATRGRVPAIVGPTEGPERCCGWKIFRVPQVAILVAVALLAL